MQNFQDHINRVLEGLNKAEQLKHERAGFTKFPPELWHAVERKKYIALDCGGSGAFLVDKETGELYNIQGYGKVDKNKKAKADLGNIVTVDAAVLHSKRWNYLR